jgi:DeoR/GlpR family transcriptional regulator of sugar metabolism
MKSHNTTIGMIEMLKRERQQYILQLVEKNGKAETNSLVQHFGVTEDTIRKDLQHLSAEGLVKRTHGGVMKIQSVLDYDSRLTQFVNDKRKMAPIVSQEIEKYNTLFIDSGTTNQLIVEQLINKFSGTIITNSPSIALIASRDSNINVEIIGGTLNHKTKIIYGPTSIQEISQLNIECTLLGVSSLDKEHGISFPSNAEAALKKELILHSQHIIAVAVKEKINTLSTFKAGNLDDIDLLFTNEENEHILSDYKEMICRVISCK